MQICSAPSMPLIAHIRNLIPHRKKYLVGVSGGADSIALLHLLHQAGYQKLVVCHVNHCLRKKESDADELFVKKLCSSLALPFRSTRVNVAALAKESNISLETAARNARHAFFSQCAKEQRCPRIILAHHADDQAETALWNLCRGSHGLKMMRPEQTLTMAGKSMVVARPLLMTRRSELRDYLTKNNFSWREDASNNEPFAARNRMRHEVIPLLDGIMQRDVAPLLARQAEAQQDQQQVAEWVMEQAQPYDPVGRLHVPAMKKLPAAVQGIIFHDYLTRHHVSNINREMIDRCRLLLSNEKTICVNLPNEKSLRRRAARIFIED